MKLFEQHNAEFAKKVGYNRAKGTFQRYTDYLNRCMAHIVVEIVSYSDKRLIVRIEQKDMVGNILLTKKELMEGAREMFKGEIPDD